MLEKCEKRITKGVGHPRGDGRCGCDEWPYSARHLLRKTGIAMGKSLRLGSIGAELVTYMDFRLMVDFTSKARYAASSPG
jgi:hypothetical protein